MSSSGLTKEVLQGMVDKEYSEKYHKYARVQDTYKGKSASDKSNDLHLEAFNMLSKPLKAVQAKYLKDVSKNCYKDKHMAETFTNME